MAISAAAQEILGRKFPVLNHGFVVLVDVMGNDEAIVQAARVSYGKGTRPLQEDRGLIRYLMRHRHTTPFEMVELKFHIKLPIFVARQWIRHRTANVNEYSARYSIMEDEFYIPDAEVLARQSSSNRQGREQELEAHDAENVQRRIQEHGEASYELYEYLLSPEEEAGGVGLARELARMVLPTSVFTQWYWKIDLHNLLHFLTLRMDGHAQYEIRVYADVMADMVKAVVPLAWEAYEDYHLKALHFTAPEIKVLRRLLWSVTVDDGMLDEACDAAGLANKREKRELREKLDRLLLGK